MSSRVATTADIKEIESVPLTRRNLSASTYEAIQQGAAINPDKIALQFFLQGLEFSDAVFYTYHDLLRLINQTANMFNGLGLGKDDVVSVILPNLPQSYFTIYGGQAAGIVNPINPLLEPQVMAAIMNAAGTKLLVTLAPFIGTDIWQKVASIAGQVPTLEMILQVDLANYLSTTNKLAVKWMLFRAEKGPKVQLPVHDFVKTARRYTGEKLLSDRRFQPDDIASYFPTSGTTGTPKLAQSTHFNQVFAAWSSAEMISLPADYMVFCGLPLNQINSAILSGLAPLMKGASVVLGSLSGFRDEGLLANFWQIIDFYKFNFFSGNPSLYRSLLNIPIAEADISSLELSVCSSAPMPVEILHQFEERTKIRILGGYSLTEGACLSAVNPLAGENRAGSIGLRIPYQEMKVVHLNSEGKYEKECVVNESGSLILRGPNIFAGYKDEAHNRSAWVDTGDGQGLWFNSGDLGRQDRQGYFWLSGREKNS
jgi:fatty-acyl-CoA synthase